LLAEAAGGAGAQQELAVPVLVVLESMGAVRRRTPHRLDERPGVGIPVPPVLIKSSCPVTECAGVTVFFDVFDRMDAQLGEYIHEDRRVKLLAA
jgi:hypothetical protein